MQFRKIAAIAGSALMATLAAAGPALAVNQVNQINEMVTVSDSTVNFPLVVVGESAASSDVAGAIGVAAMLAGEAKTEESVVTSGGAASVSNGATMAIAADSLRLWETLADSKQVLTSGDMPTLLKAGTYEDSDGVSYGYSQYLTFNNNANNGTIVYDQPSGGTEPHLGLKFAGGSGNSAYEYQLIFTKQFSGTADTTSPYSIDKLVNTQVEILGKTYTITKAQASASANQITLEMLAGKNSQTVTTESGVDYSVDGTTFTVELTAVGTIGADAAATVRVTGGTLPESGETLQIKNGQTKELSDGTMVGVTSIFTTTKTGAIDSATVFVGADKLSLADTDLTSRFGAGESTVEVNGQSSDEVEVAITGTSAAGGGAVTLTKIEFKYSPITELFLKSGESNTDPIFGAFDILFGGMDPALDDTTERETIELSPSGTNAQVAFTARTGDDVTFSFARAASSDVTLKDSGNYAVEVIEGAAVNTSEYAIISQNRFGHILRLVSASTASTSTTKFTDVVTGETVQVTGGNTSLYLDGQEYKLCIIAANQVKITWGALAGYCAEGTHIDVFPVIETSKGALLTFQDTLNISTLANGTAIANATTYNFNMPGTNWDSTAMDITSGTTAATGQINYTSTSVGDVYNVTSPAAAWIEIKPTNNNGRTAPTTYGYPSLLLLEERNEDSAYHALSAMVTCGTSTTRAEVQTAPGNSSKIYGSVTAVSGTYLHHYLDGYGTYIEYDSLAPGKMTFSYPDDEAVVTVAVGADPAVSAGGASGTVTTEKVLSVTADIAKLDTEMTETDKANNNLIVVGGPAVNMLAWELLVSEDNQADNPFPVYGYQYADLGVPIEENKAIIKLVEDAFATGKTALVIAGWDAANTDVACRVVQDGSKLSDMTGDSATVSGTTFASVTVA